MALQDGQGRRRRLLEAEDMTCRVCHTAETRPCSGTDVPCSRCHMIDSCTRHEMIGNVQQFAKKTLKTAPGCKLLGPIAQHGQSVGLLIQWSRDRSPLGPPQHLVRALSVVVATVVAVVTQLCRLATRLRLWHQRPLGRSTFGWAETMNKFNQRLRVLPLRIFSIIASIRSLVFSGVVTIMSASPVWAPATK